MFVLLFLEKTIDSFLYFFFKEYYSRVLQYIVNLLKSEGVLSSIQFAFTALLTLLIPLSISLYESRKNIEYTVDKYVINEVVNLKWLIVSVVSFAVISFGFNSDKETSFLEVNFNIIFVLLVPFVYLIFVNYRVAQTLVNIKPARKIFLFKNTNGIVLDFWEEYFKKLQEKKLDELKLLKQREKYKFQYEEREYIFDFFKKLESVDLEKNSAFAADMAEILREGFESLDIKNIFYPLKKSTKLEGNQLFFKILQLNYQSWKISNLKFKQARSKLIINYIDWLPADRLKSELNAIIEKILVNILKNDDNFIFSKSIFIDEVESHLHEHGQEFPNIESNKKLRYINSFTIYDTFFEHIYNAHTFWIENKVFPENWTVTAESNFISQAWQEFLERWLERKLKSTNEDHSTGEKIDAVLEVFFPKASQIYLGLIILYKFKFSQKNQDRIKETIASELSFGRTDFPAYEQKIKYNNFEELFKVRQNNACEIGYQLFRDVFDSNLAKDLKEIEEMENSQTLSVEQRGRLSTIKLVWQGIKKVKENSNLQS